MSVVDIQAWADNVELVRLPAIQTNLSNLQTQISTTDGELATKSQELTDRLDAYQISIAAAQSDADTAQDLATTTSTQVYNVDLSTKIYTDNKIQALRDELTGTINTSQSALDAAIRNYFDTELAGLLPALQSNLDARVVDAQTIADSLISTQADFDDVASQILNTDLPTTNNILAAVQTDLDTTRNQLDTTLQDFPYPTLLDGLIENEAKASSNLVPLGSSVLVPPAVQWTSQSASSSFKPKLPALPSWFVIDDILSDCAELPDGNNATIGQAYPINFDPDRIYKLTTRLRVFDNGTSGGVKLAAGISTWVGEMTAGDLNAEKSLTATNLQESDGDQIYTAYFSANSTLLNSTGLSVGTTAADDAVLLSGSNGTTKAFLHVRQNSENNTNGQVRIASIKIEDVTDLLTAAPGSTDPQILADIEELQLTKVDETGAVAAVEQEISSRYDSLDAMTGTVSGLEFGYNSLDNRLSNAKSDITDLEQTRVTAQGAIAAVEFTIGARYNGLVGLTDEVNDLEGEMNDHSDELAAVRGDIININNTKVNAAGAVAAVEQAISASYTNLGDLTSAIDLIEGDITALDGDVAALGQAVTTAEGDIVNLQTTKVNALEAVAAVEEEISAKYTSLSGMANSLDSAEGAITSLQSTRVTASGAVSAVEQEISAEYNSLTAMASSTAFARATVDGISSGYVWRLNGSNVMELVSVGDGVNGNQVTATIDADYVKITGTAQIGDLLVSTVKIQGNAVTVPTSVVRNSSGGEAGVFITSFETDQCGATFVSREGGQCRVEFNFILRVSNDNDHNILFRIEESSNGGAGWGTLRSLDTMDFLAGTTTLLSIVANDPATVNSNTGFRLSVQSGSATGSVIISHCSTFLLETKK